VINSDAQCLISTTDDGKHLLAGIESRSTQGHNSQNSPPTTTRKLRGMNSGKNCAIRETWVRRRTPLFLIWCRIYRERGAVNWNTYAIVAVIELARDSGKNPEVPEWLKGDYLQAIRDLAEIGATEVLKAKNSEDIQAMLSILAIAAGARTHARFLINYSAAELLEMESLASEVDP